MTEILDTDIAITDGLQPFRELVATVMEKGLLPATFDKDSIEACIQFGLDQSNWSNLHDEWVEKVAIQQHYGINALLSQMAVFTWKVLGAIEDGKGKDNAAT